MPIGDIGGLSVPSFSASIMEDLATGLGSVPDILQAKKRDKEDRAYTMGERKDNESIRKYNSNVRDSSSADQLIKDYNDGRIDQKKLSDGLILLNRRAPMKSGQPAAQMTPLADNMPPMAEPMKPNAPGSSIVATPAPRTASGPVVGPNQATATTTEIPMRSQSIMSNTVNGGKIGQSVEPKVQKPQGIGAPASVLSSNHPLVQSISKATGQNPMVVAQQLAKQSIGSPDTIDMARLNGKDFTYMNQVEQSATLARMAEYPKADRAQAAEEFGITNIPSHLLDIQPEVLNKTAATALAKTAFLQNQILSDEKKDPIAVQAFFDGIDDDTARLAGIVKPPANTIAKAIYNHELYVSKGDAYRTSKIQKNKAEIEGINSQDELRHFQETKISAEIKMMPEKYRIQQEHVDIDRGRLDASLVKIRADIEARTNGTGIAGLNLKIREQILKNNNFKFFTANIDRAQAAKRQTETFITTTYGEGVVPPANDPNVIRLREQTEALNDALAIKQTFLHPTEQQIANGAQYDLSTISNSSGSGKSNIKQPAKSSPVPKGARTFEGANGEHYYQDPITKKYITYNQ